MEYSRPSASAATGSRASSVRSISTRLCSESWYTASFTCIYNANQRKIRKMYFKNPPDLVWNCWNLKVYCGCLFYVLSIASLLWTVRPCLHNILDQLNNKSKCKVIKMLFFFLIIKFSYWSYFCLQSVQRTLYIVVEKPLSWILWYFIISIWWFLKWLFTDFTYGVHSPP